MLPVDSRSMVKVLGRTSKDNPYVLFWTGSRFEMNVKASNLSVVLKASFENREQWIAVVIDGEPLIRMPLQKGNNEIALLRNRNAEVLHNIRIIKETPIMPNDGEHYIELLSVKTDGELFLVPERRRKLVFVGDSITSGEGAIGCREEQDWVPQIFSACRNYAYMTADALNAEYQSISQSGWGLVCGYDNDCRHNMPDTWNRVCSIAYADGPERPVRGAEEEYVFSDFEADAVIINLGTNDWNGFSMPAFRNPETGETFAMRKNPDGNFSEESVSIFTERMVSFLGDVRKAYPKAFLLWGYGMLGADMEDVIQKGLRDYAMKSGETCPAYIRLPEAKGETFGARMHPGILCHKQAAEVLTGYLKNILPEEQ